MNFPEVSTTFHSHTFLTLKAPRASHIWMYAVRGLPLIQKFEDFEAFKTSSSGKIDTSEGDGHNDADEDDHEGVELFRRYCDMEYFGPRHPLAQKLVTVHGDLHPGNMVAYTN